MSISDKMRDAVRSWLRIQPADNQAITIREAASFETNCMRNLVWYRGDASEIEQLFKSLGQDASSAARFWSAALLARTSARRTAVFPPSSWIRFHIW